MIKTRINNEYKDVIKIFGGGTLQKEIIKVWSGEAQEYVYESSVKYAGSLPITITANGDALIDYRIYGNTVQSGTPTPENPIMPEGVGEPTENLFDNRTRGYYNNDNGKFVNDKSRAYWRIPVQKGDIIYANDIDKMGYGCCFYQGTYIPNSRLIPANFPYTVPAGVDEVTNNYPAGSSSAMVTVNRATPTTYIPYGYKLPMTVYKQEFVVTNDMLDQSNWILPGYWFMYFDISDFISKAECDAKIYENFADGYTPKLLVVAITDKKYSMVDDSYRILKNNGEILDKKFDFSSWDKIYLCIGYGKGFSTEEDKQLKIDELFENWKILIAPTSQTREVPVYIGENQLSEDEYVSYAEQKIYRDVSGTLTPTTPPVSLPEIPTIKGETIIDYDGEPKPSQMYVKYRR